MFGSGAGIGMEVTAVLRKQTRKDQQAVRIVCCAAVRSTTMTTIVVLRIGTTTPLSIAPTTTGFD